MSRLLRKKTISFIVLLIAIVGLGVALVLQSSIVNFWPSASTRTVSDFHRASCLKQSNCTGNLTTKQKDRCYSRCNVAAKISSQVQDVNFAKQSHKAFIDHFVKLYGNTFYSKWKASALKDSKNVDATYHRVVCNTVTASTFKGILEGRRNNDPYFVTQADKLMSVMDDFDYWTKNNSKWTSGINGYSCLVAASLLWDKLPSASGWDRASASIAGSTNRNPNRSADEKKKYMRQKFSELADTITRDYTVDYFRAEQNRRIENNKNSDIGNSIAEEAGWNGAYLALAAELLPLHDIPKEAYTTRAKQLVYLSLEKSTIGRDFPVTANNMVINHNFSPSPQYGFSVLSTSARASLALYKFSKNNRDAIYGEYRKFDRDKNVFTWIDIFEAQLAMVDKRDFSLKGKTCLYNNKQKCINLQDVTYNVPPYQFKGVSDWGTGIWFQNSVFAFSYVVDVFNSNGYRSVDSPYQALLSYQRGKVNAGQLNLPSVYKDGRWSYEPLIEVVPTTPTESSTRTSDPFGPFEGSTKEMTTRHFFLNSEAAFEDVISYMYMDGSNVLRKLD